MTESERRQIIELIKKEVIPAIGCTEPIAVALCVAKAAETLGAKPEKIEVLLSMPWESEYRERVWSGFP